MHVSLSQRPAGTVMPVKAKRYVFEECTDVFGQI
jgi:hypothetical protein